MSTHTCILYTLHRHGGEGSYLNFCMELPRELFHSKHFSNGIRWPIFLILSTRVRYKKKNTLISDREKQTIFRRFSTTIPFFFFLKKGKISKNLRNKLFLEDFLLLFPFFFFAKGKNFKKFEKQTLSIFLPSPSCSSKQRVRLFRIDTTLLSLPLFFFKPNRTTRASVFSRRYIFHPRRPKGMKGERQVKIRGERISANG